MEGRGPSAIDPDVLREARFDPAASAGLFVGVSAFEGGRFAEVAFAVDDAVDLAHLFAVELGLVRPERCVLGLAGEPRKPESGERLARLLERGARRIVPHYTGLYRHLGEQAREARPEGLLVVTVASHGFSDQGGDFLLASDSLPERVVRTGLAVDELFDTVARAGSPRRLVLLDACRERLSEETRAVAGSPMARSFAEAIARASGQVVLAGATLGGFAYDDRPAGQRGVQRGGAGGPARRRPVRSPRVHHRRDPGGLRPGAGGRLGGSASRFRAGGAAGWCPQKWWRPSSRPKRERAGRGGGG